MFDGQKLRLTSNRKVRSFNPCRAQQSTDRLRASQVSSADNQRAKAERIRQAPNLTYCSRAEGDSGRGGKFKPYHLAPSPGNTLLNFTLERGSAIIEATASRQVW